MDSKISKEEFSAAVNGLDIGSERESSRRTILKYIEQSRSGDIEALRDTLNTTRSSTGNTALKQATLCLDCSLIRAIIDIPGTVTVEEVNNVLRSQYEAVMEESLDPTLDRNFSGARKMVVKAFLEWMNKAGHSEVKDAAVESKHVNITNESYKQAVNDYFCNNKTHDAETLDILQRYCRDPNEEINNYLSTFTVQWVNQAPGDVKRTEEFRRKLDKIMELSSAMSYKTFLNECESFVPAVPSVSSVAISQAERGYTASVVPVAVAISQAERGYTASVASVIIPQTERGYTASFTPALAPQTESKAGVMTPAEIQMLSKLHSYCTKLAKRINQHGPNHRHHKFKFSKHSGFTDGQKQAAAEALRKVISKEADVAILDAHKEVLNNSGGLKKFYTMYLQLNVSANLDGCVANFNSDRKKSRKRG